MFSGCNDSKETDHGSSDQEVSPSAVKNTAISGGVSIQLFLVVWIFPRSLDVLCYDR